MRFPRAPGTGVDLLDGASCSLGADLMLLLSELGLGSGAPLVRRMCERETRREENMWLRSKD
jgi:hypothetical protein